MKSIIKITAVALGVGFAGITNAQSVEAPLAVETPSFLAKFKVFPETNRLRIYLGKQEGNENTLFMGLKDAKGNEIYSRKFGKKEKQAVVLLNLDELEEGNYTLEMGDKNGITTKVFRKGHEEIVAKPASTLIAIK